MTEEETPLPESAATMDQGFIVLGNLEFVFKSTTSNGTVVSQRLSGDDQEFELSNFSGKIIVRKQETDKKVSSSFRSKKGSSSRSGIFGRRESKRSDRKMKLDEKPSMRSGAGGVTFDLTTSSWNSPRDETFANEAKNVDRSSYNSGDEKSFLSALEEDEDNEKSQSYMSCRALDVEPPQELHLSSLMLREEDGADCPVGQSSQLHGLCASLVASLDDLRSCLADNPDAPFTFNQLGQTPLHVLSENGAIWHNSCLEAFKFGMELISINPAAVAMKDRNGVWPFASMLEEWTQEQYQKEDNKQKNMLSAFVRNVGTVMNSNTPRLTTSLFVSQGSREEPSSSVVDRSSSRKVKFPKARLTEMFQSAMKLLSFSFTSPTTVEQLPVGQQLMLRERTCRRIATEIPQLLPTLLLIEPEIQRNQILSLPLVRRLLLEPATVGPWVVTMMRRKGIPSHRAIDYLELVSETSFHDFLPELAEHGVYEATDEEKESPEVQEYLTVKTKTFNAVGDMNEFLLSLFAVNKSQMERATSTKVLWHIMQYLLQRKFIIGIVMIDFTLHLTLMLSFRADVLDTSGATDFEFESKSASTAVMAITIFFASRKLSEGMALFSMSKTVFRHYMLDFWNLFDALSIFLLIIANSLNASGADLHPSFNAFVLSLLWLKILGFLKAVNKQMATFILACIQILIDIRFFIIVLLVFIMMFGDVMIITFNQTTDDQSGTNLCEAPEGSDPQTDFCSGRAFDSYVRMYGVLLGDFELQDFKSNNTVLIIFLFFTMLGVIVLLNILIAVVSDSYEKATVSANSLFGKARVGFLAEHIALEHFLQPGSNPLAGITQTSVDPHGCFVLSSRIVRYVVLMGILVAAILAEVFLVEQTVAAIGGGKASIFVAIVTTTMCVLLTNALWVVVSYLFKSFTAGRQFNVPVISSVFGAIDKVMNGIIDGLRRLTFGGNESIGDDDNDEWTGRMDYLESFMATTVAAAEQNIKVRIQAAEDAIKEHEDRLAARNLTQEAPTKRE